MVDVKIESNGATVKLLSGLANFELGKPFMEAAGKTVVESIHRNIKNQVEPDGSPMKRNAPSTMEKKRRAGRVQRSLVDRFHRFVSRSQSFKVRATKNKAVVAPTGYTGGGKIGVNKLSVYVQDMGYRFFGLDKRGSDKIGDLVKKRVEEVLAKSRTR